MRRLLLLFALAGAMWAQPGPNGGMRACSTTPPTKGHAQSCYDTAGAIWTCVGTCTTSGQWVAAAGSGSFVQLSGDATSTASGGATTVSKFNGGTAFGSAASHASTDFQAVLANYSTISGLTGYPATFPPTTTGLVLLGAANTFTTGLQDFSTTTLKIPSGAGFTATASSMFGFDSTAGKPHIWYSAADQAFGTNAFNSTAFVQVATDIGNTAALPHVIGLTGVPFCTGFTPTNGQAIEYSTGGSPHPCWTAATPSGSGLGDPGGPGLVNRTTLNTTTVATSAQVAAAACPTASTPSFTNAGTTTINEALSCAAVITAPNAADSTPIATSNPQTGPYSFVFIEGTPASTWAFPGNMVGFAVSGAASSITTCTGISTDGVNFINPDCRSNSGYAQLPDGTVAPTPTVGTNTYVDPTSHLQSWKDQSGNILTPIKGIAAVTHQFVTSCVNGICTQAQPTPTDVSLSAVTNDAQTKAAIVPNTAPSPGQIQVGNAGGTAYVPVTMSGSCTLASTGVITCSTSSATPTFPTNPQTSTYQLLAADFTNFRTIIVASGTFTITAVASGGSQPATGTGVWIVNYGSGVVTFARSGQNINGAAANLTIAAGSASAPNGMFVVSDG